MSCSPNMLNKDDMHKLVEFAHYNLCVNLAMLCLTSIFSILNICYYYLKYFINWCTGKREYDPGFLGLMTHQFLSGAIVRYKVSLCDGEDFHRHVFHLWLQLILGFG